MAKSLILGLLLVAICCSANGSTRETMAIANLANVILKSTYYMENDPALTAKCIQIYLTKITYLAEQYEVSLNKCYNQTTQAQEELKQQVQEDIDTIQNTNKAMCSNSEKCSSITKSLYDLFECYNKEAVDVTQSAYEVQNLSNNKMKFVQMSESNIEYKQTFCTDDCGRVNFEETKIVNDDLTDCLNGKPPRTTTVQPETSKIPETTNVPETTNGPETTNVPETTKVSETTKVPETTNDPKDTSASTPETA